jgi:DNA-binding NarL/FixJ family response regulator
MPDGNGFELSRRVRAEFPETMVCICTLDDAPEFKQVAADSGATWFIAKQGNFWKDAESVVTAAFEGVRDDRRGSLAEGGSAALCWPNGRLDQKKAESH